MAHSSSFVGSTTRADGPALSRCIGIDPARFANWYWGRRPLHSPAADLPKGFDDLLSVGDLDELLSRRGLRTPSLRVVDNGHRVPRQRSPERGTANDQVLDDRVLALVVEDATLVLDGLDRIWPALIDFAVALRTDLGHPVQISACLTPPGSSGAGTQGETRDETHEIFVLQVAGRMGWRVHQPAAGGEPTLEVALDPGDALYVPRGWLHSATGLADRSLHLTVAVRTITRYAVLEALTELAAEDDEIRAALPMSANLANPAEASVHLAETVAALGNWLGRADPARVATALAQRFWPASLAAPIQPVAQADAISALSPDSRVELRPGLQWRLTGDEPERVALHLPELTMTFPRAYEPTLRALLDGSVNRLGDLPGLRDDTDRLELARQLLRTAVLIPA